MSAATAIYYLELNEVASNRMNNWRHADEDRALNPGPTSTSLFRFICRWILDWGCLELALGWCVVAAIFYPVVLIEVMVPVRPLVAGNAHLYISLTSSFIQRITRCHLWVRITAEQCSRNNTASSKDTVEIHTLKPQVQQSV